MSRTCTVECASSAAEIGQELTSIRSEEDENAVAMRKVEKMCESRREDVFDLPEDVLQTNAERQDDEILALEAIYGENLVLHHCGDLRIFQISVHHEIDAPVMLRSDANPAVEVKYLPPLVLTCHFPKTYPSNHPPLFSLAALWLDARSISSLCRALDKIWEDGPWQEVVYQWIEWLQNSSLMHLGFDGSLMVGAGGPASADDSSEDERVVLLDLTVDDVVRRMVNYDEQRRRKVFVEGFHTCPICFSEYIGSNFVRLPCEHFFCMQCTTTYLRMHVKDGTVTKIICLDVGCGGPVPPSTLRSLLGKSEFDRWEALLLRKTLEAMSDVVYCPQCESVCIKDGGDKHAQCPSCFFSFCTDCRERRHVGQDCVTPEQKLAALQGSVGQQEMGKTERRRRDMINEMLSLREALRDATRCPACQVAISRTEGCNKMVCSNCGQYFCYRCSSAISGYDHFDNGECMMFSEDREVRGERKRRSEQAEKAVVELETKAWTEVSKCPICHQRNGKVGGNNHIVCWACQTDYCALCRELVRKTSVHFGPSRCKQHS